MPPWLKVFLIIILILFGMGVSEFPFQIFQLVFRNIPDFCMLNFISFNYAEVIYLQSSSCHSNWMLLFPLFLLLSFAWPLKKLFPKQMYSLPFILKKILEHFFPPAFPFPFFCSLNSATHLGRTRCADHFRSRISGSEKCDQARSKQKCPSASFCSIPAYT